MIRARLLMAGAAALALMAAPAAQAQVQQTSAPGCQIGISCFAASLNFTNGTKLVDTGNGILQALNSAGTGFTGLILGPSGTSFIRLKPDGAGALQVRLADDSGKAPVLASAFTADGAVQAGTNVTAAAGGLFNFSGRSAVLSPADGQYKVTNNAGTSVAGQIGTATNDNACAGCIGEYSGSQVVAGSAVALTSATPANVQSWSLTAGDWVCSGNVIFSPNGSTTATSLVAWLSATSATLPTAPNNGGEAIMVPVATAGAAANSLSIPETRFSLSATTTIYESVQSTFAVSTMSAYGARNCWRVR